MPHSLNLFIKEDKVKTETETETEIETEAGDHLTWCWFVIRIELRHIKHESRVSHRLLVSNCHQQEFSIHEKSGFFINVDK